MVPLVLAVGPGPGQLPGAPGMAVHADRLVALGRVRVIRVLGDAPQDRRRFADPFQAQQVVGGEVGEGREPQVGPLAVNAIEALGLRPPPPGPPPAPWARPDRTRPSLNEPGKLKIEVILCDSGSHFRRQDHADSTQLSVEFKCLGPGFSDGRSDSRSRLLMA